MIDESIEQEYPDADAKVEPAIALVGQWLTRAAELETRSDRATMRQLGDLVADEAGVRFVMGFVDRVARPDSDSVAAKQLARLVDEETLPSFLSQIDRVLLKVGARLAPKFPNLVLPPARRRMRSIVGHLVAPAAPEALQNHLNGQRRNGYDLNVNLLGEAVLGETEARSRLDQLIALLAVPNVDYVSVKLTAVASQLNHWAFDASLSRVGQRLALLLDAADRTSPPTFVNFDMEEYHDLELTVAAFKEVLDDPARRHLDAGIVLQAYLPDVFDIMRDLVYWANQRRDSGGGTIKIRLVKGANLAMEQVDAAIHGWEQAPFGTKLEADASYRRCVDWVITPDRLRGVRIGLASHNLFDVAWAKLLADQRGVASGVQFEMLQGMASGQAKAVNETAVAGGHRSMLLYTPAVAPDDFDVAIGYLFRRLEENAAPENFMRSLFDLAPDTDRFRAEADFFRQGVALRNHLKLGPARTQNRLIPPREKPLDTPFVNEPETDPSLASNRQWIHAVANDSPTPVKTPTTTEIDELSRLIATSNSAGGQWRKIPVADRRNMVFRVGDELARRRGELITTMMHEAAKTFGEADAEVCEAIDFARWYADRSPELYSVNGATFRPLGTVAVIPPWNFPVAIPAGGVLASLAAGNTVILKPAPQTPRCAEIVAEACWDAGIPKEVMQFVRTPDNEVGQTLVTSVDGVILTGSSETADLFRRWKPQLKLLAETSGKNALIITPSADLDLAAADLVASAFGHGGQKCSAASLAILVGDVSTSERFRRQIADAVESLSIGSSLDLETDIGRLVDGGNERLDEAVGRTTAGERRLVTPRWLGDGLLSPGVIEGVKPGSWFHQTECFGPILGLMTANDLDEAIAIANSSDFGLTGGIHTLDPTEIDYWAERIQVGNGYANRPITGAIVQRQPFGGWKRSSVGPGAKAGGPNYLTQLGTWTTQGEVSDDYAEQWATHFSQTHDDTGLFCEANLFRYRPLCAIGLRIGPNATPADISLVRKAAGLAGVAVVTSTVADYPSDDWLSAMGRQGIERVRVVGAEISDELAAKATRLGIHLAPEAVTPAGRIELQHYVREQAISITLHRFGNLVAIPESLDTTRRQD